MTETTPTDPTATEAQPRHHRSPEPATAMQVRDDDLAPHEGLRYVARLFKVLAVLIALLLVAEIVLGLMREGPMGLTALLVDATRLVVFAALLWAAGDLSLMLIESNHDLRAARILIGRLALRLERIEARLDGRSPAPAGPEERSPPSRQPGGSSGP